jgi:hypothetical protein
MESMPLKNDLLQQKYVQDCSILGREIMLYKHFKVMCCLHLHKVADSSEMLVLIYQTIWHHITGDNNLDNHVHEIFKPQKLECEIKHYSTDLFLKQNIDHIYIAVDVTM